MSSLLDILRASPRGSDSKESACNAEDLGSTLGKEDPLYSPTLVFLPGESHGQRSLARYSFWDGKKSWTRLSNGHSHCD